MAAINTGHKDIIWNYIATFLMVGTGVILLPFILNLFSQETVGIWNIFSAIVAMTALLDFGFNTSFARNVSYAMSGVKELKSTGFHIAENSVNEVDYSLFKGLIHAMRWFYARIALLLFVLLTTLGTYYIYVILKSYSENHTEVYIGWGILCVINSYSLYTLYYDAILQGKGLIKQSKQIQAISQIIYLFVAICFIYLKLNLIAIVGAQALSILIRRLLSHKTIYTAEFKSLLQGIEAQDKKKILKPIYRNAVKLGIVNACNFFIVRSPILIGAMFLSLNDIASYGITMQIINVIASVAIVYITTFLPKIAQLRINNDMAAVKKIYIYSCLFMFFTFLFAGLCFVLWGSWALRLINSKTALLSRSLIIVALTASWLDYNRGMAEYILTTRNDIPFFKASLFTGGLSVFLLFLSLKFSNFGVWCLVIAPAFAQICYQNWKWPLEVAKELQIVHKK